MLRNKKGLSMKNSLFRLVRGIVAIDSLHLFDVTIAIVPDALFFIETKCLNTNIEYKKGNSISISIYNELH